MLCISPSLLPQYTTHEIQVSTEGFQRKTQRRQEIKTLHITFVNVDTVGFLQALPLKNYILFLSGQKKIDKT